ncbi:dTDP-4-dehydrorhamnose 3,5-epimerase [Aminipila sp.]|uniref:dTDP-4-dehydrorhamnose 3,5-epimerase n=1 Tax=Aminipila sp. TaxID=2060095 RepID=UPI00289CFA83|nr:dTDP-4-dehydrorhamnose 3,5-epimerase [Aminipila sp.]
MKIIETKIEGVYVIEPQVFGDERGWFMETYSRIKTPQIDCEFVQDNQSFSKEKGTLRGIHFQNGEFSQGKLVRCIRGAVLDVAVDLRKGSPTFKQWVAVELSAENKKQLFVPRGFGHAFLTLKEDVEFVYKTDNYYNGRSDRSIRFDDPEINVIWDLERWGIKELILSDKDKNAPLLKDSDCSFVY